MDIKYYEEYLHYKKIGIKSKTKEFIDKFIGSFVNYEEKELWTREYLPKIEFDSNGRIRNELFEEIIFPVLWNGYKNKNIELMVWLTKLSQNYYQNNRIWKKMDYKTDFEIIKKCYEIEPNDDVIDKYLEIIIREIDYSIHEWPYGILFGNNFATKDECKELLDKITFLRKLDRNEKYYEFINDYENKLKEYIERLEK